VRFTSTRDRSLDVGLREAVLRGMPADGGLYMPAALPRLAPETVAGFAGLEFPAVAAAVAGALFGDDVPMADLERISADAFDFPVPLVQLGEEQYLLELFWGPTLAFKDFGARFQSRLLSWLHRGEDRLLNILVATSGDTGSAVASGFFGVPGMRVVVLYPRGRISRLQERQIATLGGNIAALEVDGVFDDCQRLVKGAFADGDLRRRLDITSANSISVARLLPQSFYYFYALSRLAGPGRAAVAVPSGNFGNLTAGLMARRMGLAVERFVAATNANDAVPEYLRSGKYRPRPSQATISSAMDVGDPSNFERILDLGGGEWSAVRREICGSRWSDAETRAMIRRTHEESGYVLDPHGAVALAGLQSFLSRHRGWRGIALATAHPAKFPEVVEPLIGNTLEIPESLRQALDREKTSIPLSARYEDFREFLLSQPV